MANQDHLQRLTDRFGNWNEWREQNPDIVPDLRRANLTTLDELAAGSRSEFLWQGPFLQLPGSQVMATFAERRTYTYQGRPVDEQTHLGFDLASTKKAVM